MIILAFLLFLVTVQASNYILPVSITGYYCPDEPIVRPINYIEDRIPNVINRPPSDVSYLVATVIAITILSTVIANIDYKPNRIHRIYQVNEHNVYYQPLPPIQEENENADDNEQDDPIPFHYVNPDIQVTCTDPCICT
jgi:hypothetical protein